MNKKSIDIAKLYFNNITDEYKTKILMGKINSFTKDKVEFTCSKNTEHKNYFQTLFAHNKSIGKGFNGCPECLKDFRREKYVRTDYSFLEKEVAEYWKEKICLGECNNKTKVEFKCQKKENPHPNYMQTLSDHENNKGCPECAKENIARKKRKNFYEFFDEMYEEDIQRIENSEVSGKEKIRFKCNAKLGHPDYYQRLNIHNRPSGCPLCGQLKVTSQQIRTSYDFEDEIAEPYYTQLKNKELNSRSIVEFKCTNNLGHPNYFTSLFNRNRTTGCPICYEINIRKHYLKFINDMTPEFQELLKAGKVYMETKVDFICEEHGIYKQTLNNHSKGCRCPKCKISKGEKKILDFLNDNNIEFICQYRIEDCKNKITLPFDFAIFDTNDNILFLLEYQGQLHFYSVDYFGGEEKFKQQQINDQIKRDYCSSNNIKLIEIPYIDFDNIESILTKELKLDNQSN